MRISHHICRALSVMVFAAVSTTSAEPPKESLAGVWLMDYENPDAGRFIKLGDDPPVPPDVQADLDALNESLADAPVHTRGGWIGVSRNGRAFGLGATTPSEEPHGVWIWPNWRDASPITFEEFSYPSFVSNRHVRLIHAQTSVIVDLQDPTTLYTLSGVSRPRLVLTDDGRWASIATGTGGRDLIVGQLDPEQPDAGADGAEIVELPVAGRLDKLAWVRNGSFLVVELRPDQGGLPKLFVIRTDDLAVVDSAAFAWLFANGFTVADESLYGGIDGQRGFITVSSDGQLSWEDRGFPKEEDGDERPALVSPSGRFTLTYWDDVEWIEDDGEQAPVPDIKLEVRRTNLADLEEPLPPWPAHEVDDEEVTAARYFWLSWQ